MVHLSDILDNCMLLGYKYNMGQTKDSKEGISLNIARLCLTKTYLYFWMAN